MYTFTKFAFPVGDYYFVQPWTLSGTTYQFTFRFNTRAGIWFMDIADVTGSNIVCGIALRQLRNLLAPYRARNVPPGVLFVYAPTGVARDPGQDDFANDFGLYYRTGTP